MKGLQKVNHLWDARGPRRRDAGAAQVVGDAPVVKAFVIPKYNEPMREPVVAEPNFGDHDVIVKVRAAGLHQLDEKTRMGALKQILPYKMPLILGKDVPGVIIGAGSTLRMLRLGDEVYGQPRKDRSSTSAGVPTQRRVNIDDHGFVFRREDRRGRVGQAERAEEVGFYIGADFLHDQFPVSESNPHGMPRAVVFEVGNSDGGPLGAWLVVIAVSGLTF